MLKKLLNLCLTRACFRRSDSGVGNKKSVFLLTSLCTVQPIIARYHEIRCIPPIIAPYLHIRIPLPPHNGHFLLSPRWPLWKDSTVYAFSVRHRSLNPVFMIICHSNYSRSAACDHSRKRPALVTTTYVKPPFELCLKLCNKKLL